MTPKQISRLADRLSAVGAIALFTEALIIAFETPIVKEIGKGGYAIAIAIVCIVTVAAMASAIILRHTKCNKPKYKIIGWTLFDKNQKQFDDVHRDELTDQDWADLEDSLIQLIRRKKYKFGGNYHQYGEFGCPVMNDGTVWCLSMRHWGDIMSRVWGGMYAEYAWTHDKGDDTYKVPTKRAQPKWMTDEEIKARDDAIKAAREKAEKEREARRKEDEEKKAEQHKKDMTWATRWVRKHFDELSLPISVDIAHHVADLMIRAYNGKGEYDCTSIKWIFDENERKAQERKRKKALKQWLDTMNKLADEHESKTPEEKGEDQKADPMNEED